MPSAASATSSRSSAQQYSQTTAKQDKGVVGARPVGINRSTACHLVIASIVLAVSDGVCPMPLNQSGVLGRRHTNA
jgi:hypothetical protein